MCSSDLLDFVDLDGLNFRRCGAQMINNRWLRFNLNRSNVNAVLRTYSLITISKSSVLLIRANLKSHY